jgi:signal transduction histidine kinase
MRRRILVAMVSIALVTVIVLGVPLAVLGRRAVRRDATVRADREADSIGFALADQLAAGVPLPQQLLDRIATPSRYLVITDRNGAVFTAGHRPTDDAVVADIDAAGGAHIRLFVADGEVDHRETIVLVTIMGLGLAAVITAIAIGSVVARRLARPLDVLTDTAHALGDGDFTARAAPTGWSEVDAVGTALNNGASRIERLVAAEREFSANASHQLRTPLTALRMRLEEIDSLAAEGEISTETSAALAQVDRLDATITALLRLAREGNAGATVPLDLDKLARTHAVRWNHFARRQHRHVVVESDGAAWVQASPGAAGHALDILLENALRHGRGTVRVSVQNGDDAMASVDITDEGPGIPLGHEAAIFQRGVTNEGSGIGLALASDLVTAEHGRLTLISSQPACFRITYRSPAFARHSRRTELPQDEISS